MVAFDYPTWRTLIYPFYTRAELFFVVGMVLVILVVVPQFNLPRPAWQYALAGYVGAALFNRPGSPAHVELPAADEERVISLLKDVGFKYDPAQDAWLPPFPKWKRWSYTRVKFSRKGLRVMIKGPYRILKGLVKALR